jgi:CRP/FNR family cyclic AMP-dependent transcriptional regulator|tara:strand:- start:12 stop:524 length:513 start_codon:yes stop_codon:yes gene_type:complete
MSNLTTELLSTFSIFDGLNNEQVKEFIPHIKPRLINKNNDIIKEGDEGDSLIFLFSGDVTITKAMTLMTNKTNVDTREKEMTRLSSDIYPVFGEMSLFDEHDKRTATITALTNCDIGILYSSEFFSICDADPQVGNIVMRNIAGQLAKNLQKTNGQVLKLTTAFSLILES